MPAPGPLPRFVEDVFPRGITVIVGLGVRQRFHSLSNRYVSQETCLLALRFVEQVLTAVVANHAHVAFISHNSCNTEFLPALSVIRIALLIHPHLRVPLLFSLY